MNFLAPLLPPQKILLWISRFLHFFLSENFQSVLVPVATFRPRSLHAVSSAFDGPGASAAVWSLFYLRWCVGVCLFCRRLTRRLFLTTLRISALERKSKLECVCVLLGLYSSLSLPPSLLVKFYFSPVGTVLPKVSFKSDGKLKIIFFITSARLCKHPGYLFIYFLSVCCWKITCGLFLQFFFLKLLLFSLAGGTFPE